MANSIFHQIEEVKTSSDRSLAYSNLQQVHRFSANDPSSMEALSLSSPPLIPILISDINAQDEEIAALALKCLGFMLYHPSLSPIFSAEDAGLVLESLGKLIMCTRMKAICNLGVWCISIQQLDDGVVGSRIDFLIQAIVHALDNPFGSLSTTFEGMQAVTRMAARFNEKMRDTSNIWVPPVYRRLISNDNKERDMAERCLLKTKPIICPPLPTLSKEVTLDLKKKLLPIMLDMFNDIHQKIPMIQAWGWYISLLGSSSLKNRHLINEMLKIPEQTFMDHDTQVQIASLVAWDQLINTLLPPQKTDLEMNCCDQTNGLIRRIKVLIMPLRRIISHKWDISVHLSCLKTWHYLLHKLDVSVNQPAVLTTSFWPILVSIFSRGLDRMQTNALWISCLDMLDDYIMTNAKSSLCELDRGTAAGSNINNKGSSKDYPIKWLPWEICSLDSFLKMISIVLWQSSVMTVTSENRNLAFSYSLKIFKSILKGVEAELKMASTNYDRIQFCVTTILTFLKGMTEDMASKYCDKYYNDFLLIVFQFVEAFREELDSALLTSPLYRVSLDLKYIKEMQLSENAENVQVDTLRVSPIVYEGMVSPMVYTTILELSLLAQSIGNMLISETDRISHAIKHIQYLLFSANSLLNLRTAISFLYTHLGKLANGRYCMLMLWRIIAKALQEGIVSASLSFSEPECEGANYSVVFPFLCYPLVMQLSCSEGAVHTSVGYNSNICHVSSNREIQLELVIEAWKLLFDSFSGMQNHAEGLSQMLNGVLDKTILVEIQGDGGSFLWNSQKIDFLMVFGELVICILKHAQVLLIETSGSEAINQEACQNLGSPINNSLRLVARFMKLSVKLLKENSQAANMVICRVFAALTCFVGHICSKHDVLLLTESISDPFVLWLSCCTPVINETQQRSSILYHIQFLWTQILACLQRSQPPILFDSLFLEVQASLLQASLDHPHPPIANAAIAFWNNTYNRNGELNYPRCLLPILDKLSRSGRIILQPDSAIADKGCVDVAAPGFRRKRLKIIQHPSNLKDAKSTSARNLGVFDCWEERLQQSKADYLLEKLRRA